MPKIFGLFVLIVCFQFPAKAQNFDVDPAYVLDQWTIEDGLPVNNVVDILQAQNGYLWLATFDGLVRFDGVKFKVFQTEQYPEMPTNRILEIEETRDGSIWLLTEQGFLVQYKNGKFIHHNENSGLNGELVSDFHIGPNGNLWIAANEGVSVFDGAQLKPYRTSDITGSIQYIFAEKDGAIWYKKYGSGTLDRFHHQNKTMLRVRYSNSQVRLPIFQDPDTKWVWIGVENQVYAFEEERMILNIEIPDNNYVANFSKGPDSNIWVSDFSTNIYTVTDDSLVLKIDTAESSYISRHQENIFLENGELWFLNQSKVWKYDQQIFHNPDNNYCYLFDREGNLWIGTTTNGLIRLKKNYFKTFGEDEGLNYENVYAIIENYNNDIWIGTYRAGVNVIRDDEVINSIRIENTQYGGYITSLYRTKDSTIYAGSIGAGLSWIRPGDEEFTKERNTSLEMPIEVKSYFEIGPDSLWIGTPFGMFEGYIGNWRKIEDQRFIDFKVRNMLEAPDGSLWLATNGAGIVHYKDKTFTFFGEKEGFISNLIRSFHLTDVNDPKNYTLWVGSEDLGLIRLEIKDGTPALETSTRYGTQAGLLDYAIHNIQEDGFGYFWMNTNRGIYRIGKEQLEAYHRGEIAKLKGNSFTESDGLRNREGNGGNQSSGITASDGRIWFASQAGAVVFDPADFVDVENELVPPVVIEEIITSSGTILSSNTQPIELQKTERDFEINFTALSLVAPERNNFRYRLLGFNDEWIETNGARSAVYTNIPNGSYTFEVTASNNTGKWNTEPARMSFSIAPYFYETGWFIFSVILLMVLSIAGGVRWRINSLKESEARLKKLVLERTKDLKEEKEKTEKQAERLKELDEAKTRFFTNISHELRTPLTLIMSPLKELIFRQSEKFDEDTIEEFERMLRNSDRLLRLIDQTMELTRLEQGKLTAKVRKLNLKNFMEELIELFRYVASEKDISIRFTSEEGNYQLYADPDKLDKMIANLISNAIKFTPEGGKIDVAIAEAEDFLEVFITDSGIGISSVNQEQVFDRFYQVDDSETRFQEGSGIGLSLVKEFVELHHGEIHIDSEIGFGTIFNIRFKKGKAHFSAEELTVSKEEIQSHKSVTNGHPAAAKAKFSDEIIENADDKTTILVVEDNAEMRSFIQKILRKEYRIVTASNGEEGWNAVKEHLPDLVVADIMMPEMDGISFNRLLKNHAETASIPLIFLTAKSTKQNQIEGFEEGGDAYLTKPFDPEILKIRIKNLLESRFRLRKVLAGSASKNGEEEQFTDPFVKKVLQVLDENFTDPSFNVSGLAKKLYLDRSQVFRKLKEATDLSPGEFIKKYRMEKAAELLQHETDNISEVAYATGFKSLSYFSACFKEYFEVSPSEFLKSVES